MECASTYHMAVLVGPPGLADVDGIMDALLGITQQGDPCPESAGHAHDPLFNERQVERVSDDKQFIEACIIGSALPQLQQRQRRVQLQSCSRHAGNSSS
ncbi:hypothetical protein AWC20_22215 [Mycobacterium parmense]|nr:hypothetical protein AWC20_22215 [Mycobacterium parmense]